MLNLYHVTVETVRPHLTSQQRATVWAYNTVEASNAAVKEVTAIYGGRHKAPIHTAIGTRLVPVPAHPAVELLRTLAVAVRVAAWTKLDAAEYPELLEAYENAKTLVDISS